MFLKWVAAVHTIGQVQDLLYFIWKRMEQVVALEISSLELDERISGFANSLEA